MRISPWRFVSLLAFIVLGAATTSGATFTVISTNDNGPGTLRQAILDANTNAGLDTIAFDIPASGYARITLTNSLDVVTDPVIIDGTTQPGFSGTPIVEITAERFADGVQITAGNSVVRGLLFHDTIGDAIRLNGGGTNVIEGNVFGLDVNGYRDSISQAICIASSHNRIGGTNAAQRNVIAGSTGTALSLFPGSSHNRIIGNYIGTDMTGTMERENGSGITITSGTNNVIGGSTPAERNIISGSRDVNVQLWIGESNRIIGNFIGTDVTGRRALSNAYAFRSDGVVLVSQNFSDVGGDAPGEGNLISGNLGTGLSIGNGNGTVSNRVVGNWIGVDVTGTNALPNQSFGLFVSYADGVVVRRNVISGNRNDGLVFFTGNLNLSNYCQGNIVGLGADGITPIPNLGHGLQVSGSRWTTIIGGFNPGEGNVISANGGSGIVVAARPDPPLVAGNFIGLDATGTLRRGNGSSGILAIGTNNTLRANRIAWNGGLGIDIWPEGVNTNQNAEGFLPSPTISSATNTGTNILILGTLQSVTNLLVDIEFFLSDSCDPSGFGEGQRYLGTTSVVTDSDGAASFGVTTPTAPGAIITATAVTPYGNTSEFSPCVLMDGATNVLRLNIQHTFSTAVEWSSAALGYQLQSTTNLNPPVQWIPRTNGISDEGTLRRYVIGKEKPPKMFFRLVKP